MLTFGLWVFSYASLFARKGMSVKQPRRMRYPAEPSTKELSKTENGTYSMWYQLSSVEK